jgi:[acyl-carrier-protein] S-malonyltransferase
MGRELAEASVPVREMFDKANEVLGRDLTRIMFEGPEDDLRQTVNTQPALFVCSAAATEWLARQGYAPVIVAGHSIGEYAALYAAGALGFEEALRLVKLRAELMNSAGASVPGAMAAIIGMDDAKLTEICDATNGAIVVANYNAPGQTVISGRADAMPAILEQCLASGAKRALPLPVSGAFHSPLMEEPAAQLTEAIEKADFKAPVVPVVTNVDGLPHADPAEIRENLKVQMRSSVRWIDTVQSIVAFGVEGFFEVGSGSTLTGLIKRINRATLVWNVSTPQVPNF